MERVMLQRFSQAFRCTRKSRGLEPRQNGHPMICRRARFRDRRRGRLPSACCAALLLCATPGTCLAGDAAKDGAKAAVRAEVGAYSERAAVVAQQIWEYAELGYQEERSSRLLQAELEAAGFAVKPGIAGMPTAFEASFGTGRPVIGVLAEFDALPGLSQQAVPERRPRVADAPGHACGHHLFGAGSIAAAIAVSRWMEQTGTAGTLRVYGSPAEEGGAGKVYLTRSGLFADVDAMLHWHPGDANSVLWGTMLAVKSGKFRFRGYAAHAAAAPERGRSALDGVEAMTFMVNLLREHVPQETRIHYIITRGGAAPNIVPDFAELYLYLRHPDPLTVETLWRRITGISEAAASGTGTQVDHEVIHGSHSLLPNETLSTLLFENLSLVGGVSYDEREQAFADALYATFEKPRAKLGDQETIAPRVDLLYPGSTDVGDVSWNVPTGGVGGASWVPGTTAHSWQAVAAGGTSIGAKGMRVAAETLAMTVVDLLLDPAAIRAARADLERAQGPDFEYTPLLGDREPPLDFRR
jgi:aminobenzoyl-glutamate utilization protein B